MRGCEGVNSRQIHNHCIQRKDELAVRHKRACILRLEPRQDAARPGELSYQMHGAVVAGGGRSAADGRACERVPRIVRGVTRAQGAGRWQRGGERRQTEAKPHSHGKLFVREQGSLRVSHLRECRDLQEVRRMRSPSVQAALSRKD